MLFISHSSQDADHARELHRRLRDHGYQCEQQFLDTDTRSGIKLGTRWEKVIYDNLRDCRALLVLCSPNWAQSKWCFAELAAAKMAGKGIFPIVVQDCDLSSVSEYQAVFVPLSEPHEREAAFGRLLEDLSAQGFGANDYLPWPNSALTNGDGRIDDCPFPGLDAFDERYAAVYFGRERERRDVAEKLRQMRTQGEPRLLMIVGGSGSGKSSLLMAGVLPRLKHATERLEWLVLSTLRFGLRDVDDALFDAMARDIVALCDGRPLGTAALDVRTLRSEFANEDSAQAAKAFLDAAQALALARGTKDATVLLPIDQFEELLPQSADEAGLGARRRADKFLRFLEQLCRHRDDRLLVVGTLRSDYLDMYERHPHALKAPKFCPWRLEPFPREHVRTVIVEPARRAHVDIAPELVERLQHDTPTTDALPLLAFTLEKLYREHAGDQRLGLDEYEKLGGMEGAIAHTADGIIQRYELSPDAAAAVRLCCVRQLAQVNDKGEFVRQTARWQDIDPTARPILEDFVSNRLLTKTELKIGGNREVFVEVAHEAIFRCWEPLKILLETSADIARWRRDVRRDQEGARHAGVAWTGLTATQLAIAREWPRTRRVELGEDEAAWIEEAIKNERRRKTVWRLIIGTMTVLAVLASIAALIAGKAQVRASQEARNSLRQVGKAYWLQAFNERDNGQTLEAGRHFLAAAKALQDAGESSSVISSMVAASRSKKSILQSLPSNDGVYGAAFNRSGTRVLTWSYDGTARLWDVASHRPLRQWRHKGAVYDAALNHDGTQALSWTGGIVRLWDMNSDQPVKEWEHSGDVSGAVFNHDGKVVLSWTGDGVRLWEVTSNKAFRYWKHDGGVSGAVFSDDGKQVLSWTADMVHLWDVTNEQPLRRWRHDGGINGAAFNRDGRRALSRTRESVRVWEVASDQFKIELKHEGDVIGAAFKHDGTQILTWGSDGSARLWDATSDEPLQEWRHDGSVYGAAFDHDGMRVLSWSGDSVRLWDVKNKLPLRQWKHYGNVNGAAFSQDSRRVFSWTRDDVRLWDLTNDEPLRRWKQGGSLDGVAFNQGGTLLLTWSYEDGTARLWGLTSDQPSHQWKHDAAVDNAAFSGDLTRVVTWKSDGTVWLWDLGSGQLLQQWQHDGSVNGAAFNHDRTRVMTWSSYDGTARLWDVASDQPLRQWKHVRSLIGATFNTDRTQVLTWSSDGTARLFDDSSDQPLQQWTHGKSLDGAAFSNDGTRVVTWSFDGTARLWGVSSDQPFPPWKQSGSVYGAAFNHDGAWVLTRTEKAVQLRDVITNELLQNWKHDGFVTGATFNHDGTRVLSWTGDTVRLWDVYRDQPLQQWKHDDVVVNGAAFNGDAKRVLTRAGDGVRLWDVDGDQPLRQWKHEGPANGAVFNHDETRVLTWSDDHTARLWDITSDQPLQQWTHDGPAYLTAFNRDETKVLTWSGDGVMSLWDISLESASLPEQILDYEVRTAVTLDSEGRPRTLLYAKWEKKLKDLENRRLNRPGTGHAGR